MIKIRKNFDQKKIQGKNLVTKNKLFRCKKSDSEKNQINYETIKTRGIDWLRRNCSLPKRGKYQKMARYLNLDYKKYRDYLYQINQEAKCEISYGVAPKSPSSQHDWIALGNVKNVLDRKNFPELDKSALSVGWKQSKNRNKELIFKDRNGLGTVRWFKTGTVLLQVKAPYTLGRAKQLGSNAFVMNKLILDYKAANLFLDSIYWHSSHDVWRIPNGQTLPYLKINTYKKTHGIEFVLGDSSHRDSIEIIVCPGVIERNTSKFNDFQTKLDSIEKSILQLNNIVQKFFNERVETSKTIEYLNEQSIQIIKIIKNTKNNTEFS